MPPRPFGAVRRLCGASTRRAASPEMGHEPFLLALVRLHISSCVSTSWSLKFASRCGSDALGHAQPSASRAIGPVAFSHRIGHEYQRMAVLGRLCHGGSRPPESVAFGGLPRNTTMWSFRRSQTAQARKPALLLAFSLHGENRVVLKWMLTVTESSLRIIIEVRQSGHHSVGPAHAKERNSSSG